jgi:hypothetical protein
MARLGRFKPTEQEALKKWEESCRMGGAEVGPVDRE